MGPRPLIWLVVRTRGARGKFLHALFAYRNSKVRNGGWFGGGGMLAAIGQLLNPLREKVVQSGDRDPAIALKIGLAA